MIGHIYIGTVGMEGAFEAMGSGTVDLNWTKEHHSIWLEEEQARTGPNEAHRQPRIRPNKKPDSIGRWRCPNKSQARDHEEYKDSPALDAGHLAAAQAVEHYEISRYGTLIAWAEELALEDAVSLLEETLEEEEATHEALTEIAKTAINRQAEAA